MEHSKEPWIVTNGTDIFTELGATNAHGVTADKNDGWQIASTSLGLTSVDNVLEAMDYKEDAANARRIVAAVNYCAGIPTETLETGYHKTEIECNGCDGPCGRCQEIKIDELQDENTRLRAAVSEMERMLPLFEKIESGAFDWATATQGTGVATLNAYKQALENAKK